MARQVFLFAMFIVVTASGIAQTDSSTEVSLTIHPDNVVGHIDEKIYGHFLEHIYHS